MTTDFNEMEEMIRLSNIEDDLSDAVEAAWAIHARREKDSARDMTRIPFEVDRREAALRNIDEILQGRPLRSFATTAELLEALTVPAFCIADEDTRFYLRGLCLHHVESGELAAVACNGVRLCQLRMPVPTRLSSDRCLIIPLESITPLVKLLRKSTGPVLLCRSRTLIEISAAGFSFVSKLIDAQYVAYEALIPKEEMLPTFNRAELASALKRMDAVADSKIISPLVGFEWEAGAATLRLSLLKQPDAAVELLDAELTGSCRIAIALFKMLELAGELKGEKLCIRVNGMGAAKITVPGDDRITILQMPTAWEFGEQQTVAA